MSQKKVMPFSGLLYDAKKVDLAAVVTPPYDTITTEMQEGFYQASDYNFVRLDFAKDQNQNRYEAAKADFEKWQNEAVLLADDKPCFYAHEHHFELPDGRTVVRSGFFAARKTEDFGKGSIKPHERTLSGPKEDRLKLTKALNANLSAVFSLYSDPKKEIDQLMQPAKQKDPVYDFTYQGDRHVLWRVDDAATNQKISAFFDEMPLFIADGHHRYETALNYRNFMREQNPDSSLDAAFEHVLMYLSNMKDEGLVILPIHRALKNLSNFNLENYLEKLGQQFEIKEIENTDQAYLTEYLKEIEKLSEPTFLMMSKNPKKAFQISITKEAWQKTKACQKLAQPLQTLDVSILHGLVFEEILGISKADQEAQKNLVYWKDTAKAFHEVKAGDSDLMFLMRPLVIDQMEEVALAGEKMPQKSTYFFPKILSGLVMNPLNPDRKLGF